MSAMEPMTLVLIALPMILIAGVFAVAPRTRRGLLFGRSVSVDFADSAKAVGMIRGFRIGLAMVTLACIALAGVALGEDAPWLLTAAVPVQLAVIFLLWAARRRAVEPFATAAPLVRSARLAASSQSPVLWFTLLALAFAPLAIAWTYLRAHWAQIPDRFPMHWGLDGAANGFAARSLREVGFPLVLGVMVLALIFGIALIMKLAPGIDRERSSAILLPSLTAIGWILSLEISGIALLPVLSHSGAMPYLWMAFGGTVAVVAVVVWMIYRLRNTLGRENSDGTPDSAWHVAGLVYFNPGDAAVVVPKRTGLGWTLNFARPVAWFFLLMVVAFLASFLFVSKGMK